MKYIVIEKARTPGAKDLKPRKQHQILNPDYIALGAKEFKKLRKQDPSYRHGKFVTDEDVKKIYGSVG